MLFARRGQCLGVWCFLQSSVRRRISVPRKGWWFAEAPAGWFEVIRGPRPPSVKWPNAQPQKAEPLQSARCSSPERRSDWPTTTSRGRNWCPSWRMAGLLQLRAAAEAAQQNPVPAAQATRLGSSDHFIATDGQRAPVGARHVVAGCRPESAEETPQPGRGYRIHRRQSTLAAGPYRRQEAVGAVSSSRAYGGHNPGIVSRSSEGDPGVGGGCNFFVRSHPWLGTWSPRGSADEDAGQVQPQAHHTLSRASQKWKRQWSVMERSRCLMRRNGTWQLDSPGELHCALCSRQRASVMRSVLRFLQGPFRNALKLALEGEGLEAAGVVAQDVAAPSTGRWIDFE